jgi:hypothetical protein
MSRRPSTKEYAIYYGDEFIDLGTASYLSEKFKIKKDTIMWYASPSGIKRQLKVNKRIIISFEVENDN